MGFEGSRKVLGRVSRDKSASVNLGNFSDVAKNPAGIAVILFYWIKLYCMVEGASSRGPRFRGQNWTFI